MEEQKETEKKETKTAVALSYELGDKAPKVVASGRGYLAEKIIDRAKENKVPLHKDSELAGTLSKLEIGECIPPQLYEVVAEILVFVDRADKMREKMNGRK
jgi:flagellar biosynthesis protein